jgi:hypothetical protein
MPIPIPAPVPADQSTVTPQAYYVRDTQDWAISQERQRHNQALLSVGEYAMFALMWHIQDYEAGLVGHCTRCYGPTPGANQDVIASVYKQATQNRCPDCYGTTYEGGYKALIVRPSIFSDTDEGETFSQRGVVHSSDINVETTIGFRVRSGDYVFRANGDRFRLRVPERITLRTGFALPSQSGHAIGYNNARASLEDPNASVAYDIGPSNAALRQILTQVTHTPYDFSAIEVIRGPLIPAND